MTGCNKCSALPQILAKNETFPTIAWVGQALILKELFRIKKETL